MTFDESNRLDREAQSLIPGGAHTYAKGTDQYPAGMAPVIVRGKGCHIWDVDGNEFIEYGMGMRSVTLGHAHPSVVEAATRQMQDGSNFVRPSTIELDCARELVKIVPAAEMVKFSKNGSDVTSAAVKLSRAYTGRDYVAVCAEHPFFSVEDWFIGSTPMGAGIPKVVRDLTLKFHYNDIASLQALFHQYPGKIACVMLEPEKEVEPKPNFLQDVRALCHQQGAVFVLDEMITGFRWHLGGAQQFYKIAPDLSTFGKALANGFSVAALAGKREIMRLGGLDHDQERVFLLSTTHGAEGHALAAAIETMRVYQREPVVEHLWRQGERLRTHIERSISCHRLQGHFSVLGRPCCLMYSTCDEQLKPSQGYRTLFLQETLKRGLLAPSLVVSYAHTDVDIDRSACAIDEALGVYRQALDQGLQKFLAGRPVKPVFRRLN